MGDQSTNFAKKYSMSIEMLATTVVGEFDGKVSEEFFTGAEELYWEQLGGAAENEITEANGQQVYRQLDHLRRMVYVADYELPLMLDKRHEMRTAVNFQSSYVARTVEAFKRSRSIEIHKGMFNDAHTGKNGTTPVPFDYTNQRLSVQLGTSPAANAGLTKDKLIVAREKLKVAGYDLKDPRYKPYFSCTSREISNLLALEEATSADYAIIRALETGERTDWLGFEFVISETVPFLNSSSEANLVWAENNKGVRAPVDSDSTSIRACTAYVKDVVGCFTSKNFGTEAGKIERYRYNWGMYASWSHGATRRQEDGIVLVPCDQSVAL
jgi:hypothetical protein